MNFLSLSTTKKKTKTNKHSIKDNSKVCIFQPFNKNVLGFNPKKREREREEKNGGGHGISFIHFPKTSRHNRPICWIPFLRSHSQGVNY